MTNPIAGHLSAVLLTGASTALSNPEAMSEIETDGTEQTTLFEVTDPARDIFDWSATFTVEVTEDGGTSWQTLGTEEYTIRYLLGRVLIDAYTTNTGDVTNIDDVRISGNFLPKFTLVEAMTSDLSLDPALSENPRLGDFGQKRDSQRHDCDVSVEQLQLGDVPLDGAGGAESRIADLIANSTALVWSGRPHGGRDEVFRAVCVIADQGLSIPGDDLSRGTINLVGAFQKPAMDSQVSTARVFDWKYRQP